MSLRLSGHREATHIVVLTALVAILWGSASKGNIPSLVITPFVVGEEFCDEAVFDVTVRDAEDAALLCGSKNKNAASRVTAALDAIGPKVSPSGIYQLGYMLGLPLFRYFKKQNDSWVIEAQTLDANLSIIKDVDRPVVIYLSSNHFTDAGLTLSMELAQDQRNLMWTRSGPMKPSQYFGFPVIPWTLVDQKAPINQMRREVVNAAVDAICRLPKAAQDKIVAVSVLGEVHEIFPGLKDGPNFNIASYDATDYSPVAVAGFRVWLRQKYSSIGVLNHDLAANFVSFDTIYPPSKDIRNEMLNNYFEHIDTYAAGYVPVYGWINDKLGRELTIEIYLDGKKVGVAETGLSRTDVTDAVPNITDPNVGFRFNLDYRNISYGIHTLEVLATAAGGPPLQLTKRELVIVDRKQDTPPQIPYDTDVQTLSADANLSGVVDGPGPWQSLFYNPLAQLWLDYRNQVVRGYIEQFATIVTRSCIPKHKVFSHQITPDLYGSWNGDLLAADASKLPDPFYEQGTTLYGGTAFGRAFLKMKQHLGWDRYAVSEMNPIVKLSISEHQSMFEMHRMNGAVFVAPYFLSIMPNRFPKGQFDSRFRIAPDNVGPGSELYQALREVMTR